ncbi:MAG: Ferrichrome outer membrane transporter/phage receptor [Pseudomonas citronellolis]|nr:MAG: Ferrichrome outer membrane transporter/phage receptor [Pseudomonas citronellolis]
MRHSIVVSLLAASVAAPSLWAAEASVKFDLPAAPLASTLLRIGQQSGRQVLFQESQVAGREAPAVHGQFTAEQAIDQALSGSALKSRLTASGALSIEPRLDDSLALPDSTIRANQLDPYAPVQGYVAQRSQVGTKTDTPINEVPQSISVITRDEMDQRGVQDINAALAYTPGIRAIDYIGGQGAPDLYMRGFRAFNLFGVYQDGLRSGFNQYDTDFETFALDRLDVIRGPASVLYGQMAPGGMVNLTSKRPQQTPIRHVEVQGGSYDRQQFGLDLGDQLDEAGTLFGRVVMLQRDSGTQVDHSPNDRTYIAPSLTWMPDENNTLTVLASYNKTRKGGSEQSFPIEGTVVDSPNGHIDSDVFLGYPGLSYYHVENTSLGYSFEHRFNDQWKYQQNARYMHAHVDYISNGAGGSTVLPNSQLTDGRYYTITVQDRPKTSDTLLFDNSLQGSFSTGPIGHTVLVGVDYAHYDASETRRNGSVSNRIDVFNPSYGGGTVTWRPYLQRDTESTMSQVGLYTQDQMALDRWRLTVGLRKDWLNDREKGVYNFTGTPIDSNTVQNDHKLTGRAGLAYLFDNGITPYASYSTSFQPNTDTDASGGFLEPTEGEQYEVGVKYQPSGQDSFITLSLFDLTQKNVTDQNSDGEVTQTGKVRSRGIELEGKASLSDELNLAGSYAYNDAEILEDANYKGNTPRSVARNTASLWLDYTLHDGALNGLGLGVGQRYVGSSYNIQNTVKVPHYTLTDATVRYDLGKLSADMAGTRVSLTATNLFDKHYFTPGFYENTVFYGNRRNLVATLSYDW